MTATRHADPLAQRLADDAAGWPGEPAGDLAAAVAARLAEAGPTGRHPAVAEAAVAGHDAVAHAAPGAVALAPAATSLRRLVLLAAPLAAALLIWLAAGLADPPAPRFGPSLAALQAGSAPLQPPLHRVIDEPLLEEWRRVSAEAEGTARYLARQVTRPLRGLGLGELFGG